MVQVLINAKGLNMNPLQSLYYVSPACFFSLLVPFRESRPPALDGAGAWGGARATVVAVVVEGQHGALSFFWRQQVQRAAALGLLACMHNQGCHVCSGKGGGGRSGLDGGGGSKLPAMPV